MWKILQILIVVGAVAIVRRALLDGPTYPSLYLAATVYMLVATLALIDLVTSRSRQKRMRSYERLHGLPHARRFRDGSRGEGE